MPRKSHFYFVKISSCRWEASPPGGRLNHGKTALPRHVWSLLRIPFSVPAPKIHLKKDVCKKKKKKRCLPCHSFKAIADSDINVFGIEVLYLKFQYYNRNQWCSGIFIPLKVDDKNFSACLAKHFIFSCNDVMLNL